MSEPIASKDQPRSKRRAWRWFLAGFGIVFLLIALFWPMHFFDGQAVRRVSLWRYYLYEIRWVMKSSGALGPTSGNASAALGVLATHLAMAAIGGLVSAGIGWALRKKSTKA